MKPKSRVGSLLIAICTIVVYFVFVSHSTFAQMDKEGPAIHLVKPGFSTKYKVGSWHPVLMTISNPGPERSILTSMTAEESGRISSRTVFRRQFLMPAQSKGTFVMPGRFAASKAFFAELYIGEGLVGKEEFFGTPIVESDFIVLGGDEEGQSYKFLSGLALPEIHTTADWLASLPSGLPYHVQSYDGVSMIVLGSLGEHGLRPAQERAIEQWVRAGGLLVVIGGDMWRQYAGTRLERMLPVDMIGTRLVTNLDSLSNRYGYQLTLVSEEPVTESIFRSGKVLASENDLPIIAVRDVGLGRVFFVAFNPSRASFKQWEGNIPFWKEMILSKRYLYKTGEVQLARQATGILSQFAGVVIPPKLVLVVLLVVYFAICAASFVFFRRRGRTEIAWIAILICSPIMALATLAIGETLRGEAETSINELLVMSGKAGDPAVVIDGYAGIFSSTGDTYDISSKSSFQTFSLPTRQPKIGGKLSILELDIGDSITARNVIVGRSSLQTLQTRDFTTMDGALNAAATFTERGLEIAVENKTGFDLDDCFVVLNRGSFPMGSIGRDGSASAVFERGRKEYSSTSLRDEIDLRRVDIRRALLSDPLVPRAKYQGLLFFGWINNPQLDISLESAAGESLTQQPVHRSITLLVQDVPLYARGEKIHIPRGTCRFDILSRSGLAAYAHGQWRSSSIAASVEAEFSLPQGCKNIVIDKATLYYDYEARSCKMELFVYNWSDKRWMPIKRIGKIDLSAFSNFASPDSRIRVKVEAKPQRAALGKEIPVLPSWRIRELDVELWGNQRTE